MGVCEKVCCVAGVVEDSVLFSLRVLKYVVVCIGDVNVVFSVLIVRRGSVGVRVWEVIVFCHADVVCCVLCASCGSHKCCVF